MNASIASSAAILCGVAAHLNKKTVFELFGEAQSLAAFVYLPRRLELVEEWVGKGSLITRERLADGNSCYGYFSIAFPEAMLQGME